jgi:N-acetylneuraminate synthase/sialic acid synthase
VREITINGHRIADDEPCYVIAEVGHNHGGKFETARTMIQTAAACGASAVKLQKRDNDALYSRALLDSPYENEHSFGRTYGEHRRALEFTERDYLACRAVAKTASIDFFATAFDERSADFLMTIGVPAIKIASGGLTDIPLLKHVALLGVPLILSTGGGSWEDVDDALDILLRYTSSVALLHCTAAYPVMKAEELNLLAIVEMRTRYPNVVIGWSSHDTGISMSLVAYAYGARIIEQHFTLNRASKGTDHAFSLEPKGLQTMCEDLKKAHLAKGDGVKRLYESERKPLAKMRRHDTPEGMQVTGQLYVGH